MYVEKKSQPNLRLFSSSSNRAISGLKSYSQVEKSKKKRGAQPFSSTRFCSNCNDWVVEFILSSQL
jgi:SMC interacting uncharacterized protein involved in chromosome segregation